MPCDPGWPAFFWTTDILYNSDAIVEGWQDIELACGHTRATFRLHFFVQCGINKTVDLKKSLMTLEDFT
jgi:hypothetical protein